MTDKAVVKQQFVISDQTLDRREDIYAFSEFGKIVNRYVINDQIFSVDFHKYLNENYSIKTENIVRFCDIHSDIKNHFKSISNSGFVFVKNFS